MYAQALLSASLFDFPYEGEAQEEDGDCGLAHGVKAERDQREREVAEPNV